MKNLLILIVAIAIFLHFYPQPELNTWAEKQKNNVLEQFSNATDTKVKLSAGKVYRDIKQEFENFSDEEEKFIDELTSSRESIKAFYVQHCEQVKRAARLHQDNQAFVCKVIARYQSFF